MTPDPVDDRGNYVLGVDIVRGQIVITYGHDADERLHGLTVVLTPYVSDAMSVVWQCGYAAPPLGLVAIAACQFVLFAIDGTSAREKQTLATSRGAA